MLSLAQQQVKSHLTKQLYVKSHVKLFDKTEILNLYEYQKVVQITQHRV